MGIYWGPYTPFKGLLGEGYKIITLESYPFIHQELLRHQFFCEDLWRSRSFTSLVWDSYLENWSFPDQCPWWPRNKKSMTSFFLTQNPPKKTQWNFLPYHTSHHNPMDLPSIKYSLRTCELVCASLTGNPFPFRTRFNPGRFRSARWTYGTQVASTRRHVLRKFQVENLLLGVWKKKKRGKPVRHLRDQLYLRSTPHPVTVTTRIIAFLVGNPYKPSFATVTVRGPYPSYTLEIQTPSEKVFGP